VGEAVEQRMADFLDFDPETIFQPLRGKEWNDVLPGAAIPRVRFAPGIRKMIYTTDESGNG
jgi:hypothetical protein